MPNSTASPPLAAIQTSFPALSITSSSGYYRARQDGDGARDGLAALLDRYGFDRAQHGQIQADLRAGRIGLAQNRLPATHAIEDVPGEELDDDPGAAHRRIGEDALAAGAVAVVSLAGGIGTRWTKGAGVVKALSPFARLGGRHRSFVETHLAKSLRTGGQYGAVPPHIFTTSYLTHDAIERHLASERRDGYPGPLVLSPGRMIGLRMIPMERDLRFAWEEMPQQLLDDQAQKVRESLHATLIAWAKQSGEGEDYTDNLPSQCLHPVGHWYEVPNLLLNGTLARLLEERPGLRHILVHNIDTVGAGVDPGLLGLSHRQRRRNDGRGSGASPGRPWRGPGPRRRPAAAGGRAGAARRGSGVAALLLQQRHVLDRYRPAARGVRAGPEDLSDNEAVKRGVRGLAARMPTTSP